MLGTIPTNIKAMCQLTAQAGPVFKGGGTAQFGFALPITRTAAGNYSLTTDANTPLVTTANATVCPDFPIMTSLRNPGAANGCSCECLLTAANTAVCQTIVNAALADVDFALIILGAPRSGS